MFAVLKTGGKQYRVASGDVLRIELVAAEAGDKIQFNDILMLGTTVGTPLIAGAAVQAEVIDTIKADKVVTFHKRRRKHSSQRTRGHRQKLSLVRVTDILESGAESSGVKAAEGAASARVAAHGQKGEPAAKAEKPARTAKADPKAAGKAPAKKPAESTTAEKKASGKKAPAKTAAKAEAPAAASVGSRPANLLKAARAGKPDDLKLISGVGPKLEATLHENGVFHFDQIAAWNSDEIAYMDEQLSFKGRIERDDWIAQASKLSAEKE